ncbi:hypothetical protein DYB26_016374 [Aphanomyces astaci]|nr:hypothetical protein DYB26_016374 [Aphanomyces astaci]
METHQLVRPYEVTVHHACRLKMYHEGGREVTEDLEAQIAFGDGGFHVEHLDEARCVDGQHQVLVKWLGLDDEESSWENLLRICWTTFQSYNLDWKVVPGAVACLDAAVTKDANAVAVVFCIDLINTNRILYSTTSYEATGGGRHEESPLTWRSVAATTIAIDALVVLAVDTQGFVYKLQQAGVNGSWGRCCWHIQCPTSQG